MSKDWDDDGNDPSADAYDGTIVAPEGAIDDWERVERIRVAKEWADRVRALGDDGER